MGLRASCSGEGSAAGEAHSRLAALRQAAEGARRSSWPSARRTIRQDRRGGLSTIIRKWFFAARISPPSRRIGTTRRQNLESDRASAQHRPRQPGVRRRQSVRAQRASAQSLPMVAVPELPEDRRALCPLRGGRGLFRSGRLHRRRSEQGRAICRQRRARGSARRRPRKHGRLSPRAEDGLRSTGRSPPSITLASSSSSTRPTNSTRPPGAMRAKKLRRSWIEPDALTLQFRLSIGSATTVSSAR